MATARLKTLHETIHPWVLGECLALLSVGFRRRRAGYSFEWPAYSDSKELASANILDFPYFMEETKEEDAPPQYHEHLRQMLSTQGAPATKGLEADDDKTVAPEQPMHPMLPVITELLREAVAAILGRTLPHVAPYPKALDALPDAVAELMEADESINVLMVETRGAKRFQLPPKDNIVSWSLLTHRVTE